VLILARVYLCGLLCCARSNHTIRTIDGVVGVPVGQLRSDEAPEAADSFSALEMTGGVGGVVTAEYVARAVSLLCAAVPVLLKELANIIAEYARTTSGVRTIAGAGSSGHSDGPALQARMAAPCETAIDETDPVAGPQLIISDYGNHCIRSMNLRTQQITTIAGVARRGGHRDGPVAGAQFNTPFGLAVAPSGAIFVADQGMAIRRISPGRPPSALGRVVETLAGRKGGSDAVVLFARSSHDSFRTVIGVWTLCLEPLSASTAASAAGSSDAHDHDGVRRLFAGAADGVHVFDLRRGQRTRWPVSDQVTGLALSADGARLFALTNHTLTQFDTLTGAGTRLVDSSSTTRPVDAPPPWRGESSPSSSPPPSSSSAQSAVKLEFAVCCALDREAGALVYSEHSACGCVDRRCADGRVQ
jgi:hypothetical protein